MDCLYHNNYENKIADLYTDLDEASSDLAGYTQELIDIARGK